MDYDAWKSGWYECEAPTLCKHCEHNEQTLDEAREYLEEVVKQLYSKDSLDNRVLEHCLDELCFALQVKMNGGELQVERKSRKSVFFHDLMKLNNDLLKQIAQ